MDGTDTTERDDRARATWWHSHQMTLGECMAIVRAATDLQTAAPRGLVNRHEIVSAILERRICSVCGYTEDVHNHDHRRLTCGSYTARQQAVNT